MNYVLNVTSLPPHSDALTIFSKWKVNFKIKARLKQSMHIINRLLFIAVCASVHRYEHCLRLCCGCLKKKTKFFAMPQIITHYIIHLNKPHLNINNHSYCNNIEIRCGGLWCNRMLARFRWKKTVLGNAPR